MKSFANWMLVILMVMYWILRIMVAYMYSLGKEFIATPIDFNTEVALLFVTLLCIALVVKRVTVGGIIYVIAYFGYFGVSLYNQIMPMVKTGSFNISGGMDMFLSFIALILALCVMIDLLSDKTKKPDDKKTEWFFNNKDLDRNLDDRDDHNQYKLY